MSTAEVGRPWDNPDAVCWQCGALALPECAYALKLVAWPRLGLPALGHPVKRGDQQDEVTVHVPRCTRCRVRSRIGIAIMLAVMAISAILGAMVNAIFWPTKTPQPSGADSVGNLGAGLGLVLGFVAAALTIAAERRAAGRRPVTTYPPVLILRETGWHYPVH
jgi:hypothetical protein